MLGERLSKRETLVLLGLLKQWTPSKLRFPPETSWWVKERLASYLVPAKGGTYLPQKISHSPDNVGRQPGSVMDTITP